MAEGKFEVPYKFNRGGHDTEEAWIESARRHVELMAKISGHSNLDGCRVLDIGCGTKLTKAVLDDGVPLESM